MAFSKLCNSLKGEMSTFFIEGQTEPETRCIYCRTKERLRSFTDLKRGSHICIGGRRFMLKIGGRQVAAYTHHAIVKSVNVVSHSTAKVTLIHFYTTPYDLSVRIQETTDLLDLFYYEVNVIRYKHPTHPPDTIIERAERLIRQNRETQYSLFSCNCEHFCNWCCVGNAKSYQTDSIKNVLNRLLTGMTNVGGNSLSVVSRVVLMSLSHVSKITSSFFISAPWGVIGIMTLLYLLYVVHQNSKLDDNREKGDICSACCRRKRLDLWMQFFAYCVLQAGGLTLLSLIISAGASHGIVLGSLLVCSVLSLICISAVPKFRKLFSSPFRGRAIKVRSMEDIWIGDIVSFQQWNMSHSCVVSAVKSFPGTNSRMGELKIIHYAKPYTLGRRKIFEEVKPIHLDKDTVFSHDYTGYKVHKPEIVVHRARQRIGETKHSVLSNRSCHFCHWAKVDDVANIEQDTISEHAPVLRYLREVDPSETISVLPSQSVHIDHTRGRKHASKCTGKTWAKIRDEVEAGQLIEFKLNGFWHKAVSTEVRFDEQVLSKLNVTVVHYGKYRKICEETLRFDLNRTDIWIHRYHPLYRHKKEDIIKRARARINEGKCSLVRRSSLNFANEIVEKGHTSTVSKIDEIIPGDVVCFPYFFSCSHEAIVSNVIDCDSNLIGKITAIHCASDYIIHRRTIKEETITLDLTKVYKKNYQGYMTYPPYKVVERARSTLGTQRTCFRWNTSADFVHWAKVVQYPVLVSELRHSQSEELASRLLVPRVGRRMEEFQRFSAIAWSDLFPGVIVEFRTHLTKNQGIVSHVDETKKEIKVIQYRSDRLFAPKTVREESMKLDLRYDNIWVYRGHPKRCNKTEVVLSNARRRLGEMKENKKSNAWEFCKECVLKPKSAEI